jgi:hypothetical protein
MLAQLFLGPDTENLLCAFICFAAGSLLLWFHFEPLRLHAFPISGMMVALPTVTTLLLPLVLTTLEGNRVTNNLQEPVTTFSVAALSSLTLILAHWFYRQASFIHGLQQAFRENVLVPMGCFRPPAPLQLFIMGVVGFAGLVYIFVIIGAKGEGREGTVVKLVEAVMPYAYAPFILLVPRLFSNQLKINPALLPILAVYLFALFVFAIAGNYRFGFAIAVMVPVLCYLVGLLTGRLTRAVTSMPLLLAAFAIGTAGFVFASNLALAMQLARINRGEVSGAEMVRITLSTFGDSAAIRELKQNMYDEEFVNSTYSEYYIANPLISRFVLIKFHDNGHFFRKQMGPGQRSVFKDFL